jgi:hypothetical protein
MIFPAEGDQFSTNKYNPVSKMAGLFFILIKLIDAIRGALYSALAPDPLHGTRI